MQALSLPGPLCPQCEKPAALCICAHLQPHANRFHVAILQHPQEPDKALGSARLTTLQLEHATLHTGLSCANLKQVVGFDADPSRWLVLFLGAKYKFEAAQEKREQADLLVFDRNDESVPWSADDIDGILALDGTWAQAKTLWWRNPWLLKLRRAVVFPHQASLYGKLRREPRHEAVSTIESVAYTLQALGENPEVPRALLSSFRRLLQHYRDAQKSAAPDKEPRT